MMPKEDVRKKTKNGITEDGQRLYDGYGNYKVLCPVCKINFMNKNAKMCKKCHEKESKLPKVDKEKLYNLIDTTNSYAEAGRILGIDRETISKWHRYYANEDKQNGVAIIISDKAPSRDILKSEIRSNSFEAIGRKYGNVNGNTVKKWCERYCLPHLRSEIENINDEDWEKI